MDSGQIGFHWFHSRSRLKFSLGSIRVDAFLFAGFIGTEAMALSTEEVVLAHEAHCFPLLSQIIFGAYTCPFCALYSMFAFLNCFITMLITSS
jgi:hypothetical protein